MRHSREAVIGTTPGLRFCTIYGRSDISETIRIDVMSCKTETKNTGMIRGKDKSFIFEDKADIDYTGAQAVDFDIRTGGVRGPSVLSKSLGSGVSIASYRSVVLAISDVESEALPTSALSYTLNVTTSTGEKYRPISGRFKVED